MPAHLTSTPTTRAITASGLVWTVLPDLDPSGNLRVKSGRWTLPVTFRYDTAASELNAYIDAGFEVRFRGDDALVLRNWRLDIKHGLWPAKS